MLQLIYASASAKPFSTQELRSLLIQARARNQAAGISGMLLYDNGSFLQILEGPDEAVTALFEKISKDVRHTKILLLFRDSIKEKEFEDWSMGFVDASAINPIEGYIDYVKLQRASSFEDATIARKTLRKFQKGMWRKLVDN